MYGDFNYTTTFGKKERNKDNTGPDMNDIAANDPDVSEKEIAGWRLKLAKLDGKTVETDKDTGKKTVKGKGGKIGKAGSIIAQHQANRKASRWEGDANPDPVRKTKASNPYQVTSDGYSGGMKSSEGPQTTLLRGIDYNPEPNRDPETGKKKNKNKNYEDYIA